MSIVQQISHSLLKYIPIKFLKSSKELYSTICGGKLFQSLIILPNLRCLCEIIITGAGAKVRMMKVDKELKNLLIMKFQV